MEAYVVIMVVEGNGVCTTMSLLSILRFSDPTPVHILDLLLILLFVKPAKLVV